MARPGTVRIRDGEEREERRQKRREGLPGPRGDKARKEAYLSDPLEELENPEGFSFPEPAPAAPEPAAPPAFIGDRDFTEGVAARAMAPRDLGPSPAWPQVERKATAPPAVRAPHKPAVFEHHANVMRFSREGDPYLYDFDAASKSFTVSAGPGGVGAEIGPDHPAYENLMGHMREANTEADPLGESEPRPEEISRYGYSETGAVADLEAENLLQTPVGPGRGLGSGGGPRGGTSF